MEIKGKGINTPKPSRERGITREQVAVRGQVNTDQKSANPSISSSALGGDPP